MIESISKKLISPIHTQEQSSATNSKESFSTYLMDALNQVNQDQIATENVTQKLITGEIEDIHQVMIVSQQANLSLQLTMQIRNKVVEAYQEIMRMPL